MEKLGEQIRRARRERGLSQEQLAEKLGVERLQVNRWENGKQQPRADALARLSNVLEKPIDWFYQKVSRFPESGVEVLLEEISGNLSRVLAILEERLPAGGPSLTDIERAQTLDAHGRPFVRAERTEARAARKDKQKGDTRL